MDDVFDTTGKPPAGWMHAIFDGGPFADDVGRCVPGPPPPDPLLVGETTYLLRTVGSWSDPDDPIAIYGLTHSPSSEQMVPSAKQLRDYFASGPGAMLAEAKDAVSIVEDWLDLLQQARPEPDAVSALATKVASVQSTGSGFVELRTLIVRWLADQ